MALIDRNNVPAPVVPQETVPMPSLGGDVLVRGLLLDQRLQFGATQRELNKVREGETQEQAWERAGTEAVPLLLALTVVLQDGLPMWAPSQWQAHGATHHGECMDLFNTAWRLSGFDGGAAAKN